jgi:hypothetical protein
MTTTCSYVRTAGPRRTVSPSRRSGTGVVATVGDHASSAHHSQSEGAGGHEGSGTHPALGSHPGGAGGHPGGGVHRRRGRALAAITTNTTAPHTANAKVMTSEIHNMPAASVPGGLLRTALSTCDRRLTAIAVASARHSAAPRSANCRWRWWRRTFAWCHFRRRDPPAPALRGSATVSHGRRCGAVEFRWFHEQRLHVMTTTPPAEFEAALYAARKGRPDEGWISDPGRFTPEWRTRSAGARTASARSSSNDSTHASAIRDSCTATATQPW